LKGRKVNIPDSFYETRFPPALADQQRGTQVETRKEPIDIGVFRDERDLGTMS